MEPIFNRVLLFCSEHMYSFILNEAFTNQPLFNTSHKHSSYCETEKSPPDQVDITNTQQTRFTYLMTYLSYMHQA